MKTKIMDKKGKKRSLSETFVSIKSNQKQGNVGELNKSPKRPKFAGSKQNGNPTLAEKVPIFKAMDEQKKEQGKIVKQQGSIVKSSKTKRDTKEKAELTIVKKETASKTSSRSRRRRPYSTVTLTVEQITKKIREIKSREVLSKRAKKILGILNRKLRECANESEKLDTVGKESNKKTEHRVNALMKNRKTEAKTKTEKKLAQSKGKLQEEGKDDSDAEEDEDDSDAEEDEDDSDAEQDEDNSNVEEDEDDNYAEEDEDDSDIEEESDESEVENKLVDNKKEENDNESDEDEEVKQDEEDEEDEEEEGGNKEDTIKKAKLSEVGKEEVQNKNKQASQSLDNQKKEEAKKKRYVLFVGNLPLNITENEIKQHFLTKVDTITSVRIPTKPDKTPRGFAYVEVTNNIDFEKGLSLNHTFLKKRRINVEYSIPTGGKKADATKKFIVAKNMKLQALQKAGKLAGGNQKKKNPFNKKK